jgi:hypothetical protein
MLMINGRLKEGFLQVSQMFLLEKILSVFGQSLGKLLEQNLWLIFARSRLEYSIYCDAQCQGEVSVLVRRDGWM